MAIISICNVEQLITYYPIFARSLDFISMVHMVTWRGQMFLLKGSGISRSSSRHQRASFSSNGFHLKQPRGVLLSEAVNYLIIPINSLTWKKENIECSVSKLRGLLEKRILRSRNPVGDTGVAGSAVALCLCRKSSRVSDCGAGGLLLAMRGDTC